MLKYLARLAIFFFALPISAQQILGGAIDFEIDTTTNSYTFYTTTYQRGLLNLTPNAFLTGPVAISQQLFLRDTLTFADCSEPIIRSVYKTFQPVQLSVPGASGSVFVFSRCCNHQYENIPQLRSSISTLTIRSDWDSVNQVPTHPRVGTWSSVKPELISIRERGLPQSVQFSKISVDPLIDSVQSEIVRTYSGTSGLMPLNYTLGYSALSPFPDSTENPLNASNQISSGGIINFNVQPDGDTAKYYIYAVKYDNYKDGRLISSQLVNNSLILLEINNQRATPLVSLRKDGITQNVNSNSQVFSYDVKVGDTLEVLLKAIHPFQKSTLLTNDGSNLNLTHLNSAPLYSQASLIPQNGFGGTLQSTDSNLVLFRFIPLGNNYVLGPKSIEYNFNFSEGYCIYPERQGFKIRIDLDMDPAIGDELGQLIVADTIKLCIGDSINVQSLGDSLNFLWEHPVLTNTNLAQQGEISFFPISNSWLYLGDTMGNRTDSVYLYHDIPPMIPLQRNLNSFSFNPNAISALMPAYWLYNGVLPLYSPKTITEMPIQGSGTYGWQLEDPRFDCPLLSEVDTVMDDNVWGSLFEDIDLVVGETYPNRIRVFIEVTSDKKIDSVYFLGFDPFATPRFSLRNQLVFFDLYEDNVKIVGSTNVFLGTTKIAFGLGKVLEAGKQYHFDFTLDPDDVYNAKDLNDVVYPLVHNDIIVKGVQRFASLNSITQSNSCPQIGFKYNESISTREEALFQLSIYPNPSTDRIKVSMPDNSLQEIFDIHDIKGKTLMHGAIKHGQTIDISHLPKGIYYLKLANGFSEKIVKS